MTAPRNPIELRPWLMARARAGEAAVLAEHADAGMPVDLPDPRGNTLLMWGAVCGQVEVVRVLAGRGADVDARNDDGRTPLAVATFLGHVAVVEALLALGADADLGTPSARAVAAFTGSPEISALLGPASSA